jgi:hypothetical protein
MTERAKYWRGLLREHARSGLTQAAFCRHRQVNPGTFAWWKRQLTARSDGGETHGSPGRRRRGSKTERFVELRLPSAATPVCEIVLARGRTIRLFGSLDLASVARLITAVESAC